MKYLILAALAVTIYASPIQLQTRTGTPIPTIPCGNDLCAGMENGMHPVPGYPRYFVVCENLQSKGCFRCAAELVFSETCLQCLPADRQTQCEQYYTGTTVPNTVCKSEDIAYAIRFCQNLYTFPGYGPNWKNATGDFAYEIFSDAVPITLVRTKTNFYISCVEGMYGWCRFCPEGLIWHHLFDDNGVKKLDCGKCDYPPTP